MTTNFDPSQDHFGLRQRDMKEDYKFYEDSEENVSAEDDDADPDDNPPSWWLEKPLYFVLPYLHMKIRFRASYFLIALVILSALSSGGDLFQLKFFSGKHSIFNIYFVKLGWGWSLSLILFLRLGCLPLHANWKHHLWNLLIRVSTLSFFFYIWCQLMFPLIEEWTGQCVKNGIVSDIENINKKQCLKLKDHHFYSVDISGHAFLMPYCILCLMEESKELIYVLCLGQFLRKSSNLQGKGVSVTSTLSTEESDELRKRYTVIVPLIVVATLCTVSLSIIWDLMFLVTSLYYHRLVEKALGALLAIGTWYGQYGLLFPSLEIL